MTAVRWGVRLGAFYLLLQSLAFAQVTTADIVGRVTDATGAVLPGATVTITNEGTRDVRSAPTNESGDYAFNLLPIGTYAVKVELQGFGTQNTRLIALGRRPRAVRCQALARTGRGEHHRHRAGLRCCRPTRPRSDR